MINGKLSRRAFGAAAAGLAAPAVFTSAFAQARPIRIGASVSLTGPVAAGVRAGMIGYELWRDDVNAAGGLLGRPVELVTYDDQSASAPVPGIYSRLVDVDRVDLLFGPYGANLTAAAIPLAHQRDRVLIGMFSLSSNDEVRSDKFFQVCPWGPNGGNNYARGFFDIAKEKGYRRVAILAADAEFAKTAAAGGEAICREYNLEIVLNQTYPPPTTDFSALLRNVRAANPDVVFLCSYPPDSAGFVRGVSEIGLGASAKLVGGSMVGPQYAALLEALGPGLNGFVNFHLFVPEPTMRFPGIESFLTRYQAIARERNVDALGHYIPPFYYAAGQVLAAAVKGTESLDQARIAAWLHANPVDTIVGRIAYDAIGNWTERRVLMVQLRGLAQRNVEQFRQPGKQVIVDPPSLRSGDFVPFAEARG